MLLGIGGSGKSTFSKQMQIINKGNFDDAVAKNYRGVLLTNIILGLKSIGSQKQDLENTDNYKKSRWILSFDENTAEWNAELTDRIRDLWNDEGVRETWEEIKDGSLIQLDYLMQNFDRYLQTDFVPNNDDILRARQRTTGGETSLFEAENNMWELTDVGGQYNERVKWNGYFDTPHPPNAIIFFLALDEYNIPNTELKTEKYATKFELALSVFREILCSAGPVIEHKTCRLVFLNKMDLFAEKIKDDKKWGDFQTALDYTGERTPEDSIKFIEDKLIGMDKIPDKDDEVERIKVHVTNALDTDLMRKIFGDIRTSVLAATMKYLGVLN